MPIEISGIERNVALRERVGRQIRAALEPLRVAPVKAQVAFFDDNGPKGGIGLRCAVTVRVPYRPAIRVEFVQDRHDACIHDGDGQTG